jgi:DNA-binding NarL/FixJ family response regulator
VAVPAAEEARRLAAELREPQWVAAADTVDSIIAGIRGDLAARDQLTAQELQIAQLAAHGLSNRDIAQRLYLSHRIIGTHLYRIFPKLGITSRGELRSAL